MDDFERQVIDAILDGDPGETVMETPGDKWVSLKHIYPRIATALRAALDAEAIYPNQGVGRGRRDMAERAFLAALKGGGDG